MIRWVPDSGLGWWRWGVGWTIGVVLGPLIWRLLYEPRLSI